MKSTPAVFLTSLAVSAISLTIPLPEATTVLNLFIGEDLTAQETAYAEGDVCEHEADDATSSCTSTNHHRHDKATQTGGAPLTRSTVYRERITPNVTQPLQVSSPEQKHAVYSRLTRRLYINEQASNPDASYVNELSDRFASSYKRLARRIGERCRQAGASEIAAILHR
ncbi:hypothetical protein [Pontibacter russatus]|uniref:hypothetical protein n=1 Tax=Pontibacter russatus TaxID=2694929 RepID=UPI00137A4842|nr:hypothetical protein [Pontibacter russatus]